MDIYKKDWALMIYMMKNMMVALSGKKMDNCVNICSDNV